MVAFSSRCVLAAASAPAQERSERSAAPQPPSPGVLRLLPGDAVSEKQIDVGGRKLTYTATAGTLSLYDQSGERTAAVFYTAYAVKGEADRPVTFAFNGGPGAASAYLHLGLVGPRIIDFGPMAATALPPGCATIRRAGSISPISC